MSAQPELKSNAEDRIKELEERIHKMEKAQPLLQKIHTRKPDFKSDGKSLDYLEGYVQALDDFPGALSKQHSVAETVPAQAIAKHGRKIGEPIDEDELIKETGGGTEP